jgi:hypothetical protein
VLAVRRMLIALGVLVALALVALGASAVLDRPATTVTTTTVVEGSKLEAWEALTDYADYDDWNPVITHAEGEAQEGTDLELDVTLPGHGSESLDAKVLVARPVRKVGWQARLLLPGLRDWEYEFILEPAGADRVLVTQQLRIEGLLAPFADAGAAREALELEAQALADRLERSQTDR